MCALALAGCGSKTVTLDDYHTQVVLLPDGAQVRAELMIEAIDLRRGMMFRESLAPDHGMLFLHPAPGQYKYYMYQVRIPLDIVWLDRDKRIVEIAANVPPCPTRASECPQYGGSYAAMYVLELAGGVAAHHGLKTGDTLRF